MYGLVSQILVRNDGLCFPIAECVLAGMNMNMFLFINLYNMNFGRQCIKYGFPSFFHGWVLIDSTKDNIAKKDSPANLSLRDYEVIDDIKEEYFY